MDLAAWTQPIRLGAGTITSWAIVLPLDCASDIPQHAIQRVCVLQTFDFSEKIDLGLLWIPVQVLALPFWSHVTKEKQFSLYAPGRPAVKWGLWLTWFLGYEECMTSNMCLDTYKILINCCFYLSLGTSAIVVFVSTGLPVSPEPCYFHWIQHFSIFGVSLYQEWYGFRKLIFNYRHLITPIIFHFFYNEIESNW